MSSCCNGCPREQQQLDPVSLGPVEDQERIARGAFEPPHGKAKNHNITNQLIKIDELIAGSGSFYRLHPPGIEIEELIRVLRASRPEAVMFALTATLAENVRAIKLDDGGQAFCVVDECECDQAGNKHPAHAHISFCRLKGPDGLLKSNADIQQAFRDLLALLRSGTSHIWQLVPQVAA